MPKSKPKSIAMARSQSRWFDETHAKLKRREHSMMAIFKDMANEIMSDLLRIVRDELAAHYGLENMDDYKFDSELRMFILESASDEPKSNEPEPAVDGGCPAGIITEGNNAANKT